MSVSSKPDPSTLPLARFPEENRLLDRPGKIIHPVAAARQPLERRGVERIERHVDALHAVRRQRRQYVVHQAVPVLADQFVRHVGEAVAAVAPRPLLIVHGAAGCAVLDRAGKSWHERERMFALPRSSWDDYDRTKISPAGAVFDATLGPGEALRIMTGAPMPAGADPVYPQEVVERSGPAVRIPSSPVGVNVRHRGEDVRAGTVVLPAGGVLRPQELGVAASAELGPGQSAGAEPSSVAPPVVPGIASSGVHSRPKCWANGTNSSVSSFLSTP